MYRCGLLFLVVVLLPAALRADYAICTVPGTDFQILIESKVTFNPGGTVTLRHPRGTLYFSSRDVKVLRTPTRESVFGRKSRGILAAKDVDQNIELAKWALHHGMLSECKSLLSSAWKIDAEHPKIKKLATMMQYLNRSAPANPSIEQHARDFVGGARMKVSRSKHFMLLHDGVEAKDPVTKKTRAEMRLELLEKVYESYFLAFALEGFYLRPPRDLMEVVLFSQHKDFMMMERRLEMGLRQVAGFYLPKDNIAMFYDMGASEQFKQLMELAADMNRQKEAAKRARSRDSGEIIRYANTISLLVDIQRESEDVATVSHEAVHQLAANSGLFPRDGAFIRWVHEGLASFFESSKMARWSGVGVVDSDRIDYYRALEGDPLRGSLEFIASDLGFVVEAVLGDQLPAYGQAWALTHFLYHRRFDQLIQFYGAIRSVPKNLDPGEKAEKLLAIFDQSFGDRVKLELEWRRYMRSLKTDIETMVEGLQ
jgi:hypothetical protein